MTSRRDRMVESEDVVQYFKEQAHGNPLHLKISKTSNANMAREMTAIKPRGGTVEE